MANDVEPIAFTGGLTASGRVAGNTGWRGHGRLTVDGAGIEFALDSGFRWLGNRYVKRDDLAFVYPVQARRLSVTSLIAAVVPRLPDTAVRFVTHAVGAFNDRDAYLFASYRDEQGKLIDLLEELGYPVDRKPKTLRLRWENEA